MGKGSPLETDMKLNDNKNFEIEVAHPRLTSSYSFTDLTVLISGSMMTNFIKRFQKIMINARQLQRWLITPLQFLKADSSVYQSWRIS